MAEIFGMEFPDDYTPNCWGCTKGQGGWNNCRAYKLMLGITTMEAVRYFMDVKPYAAVSIEEHFFSTINQRVKIAFQIAGRAYDLAQLAASETSISNTVLALGFIFDHVSSDELPAFLESIMGQK